MNTGLIALAAALSVAISAAFAALAQGKFASSAMEAMGRQPEAAKVPKACAVLLQTLIWVTKEHVCVRNWRKPNPKRNVNLL